MDLVNGQDNKSLSVVNSKNSTSQNERKQLPDKLKYFTAGAIFYGNIFIGCSLNSYGPTVTNMQNKYETDDATISKVFTILTGCYMLGALAAGCIFNYINRQLAVATVQTTMALMLFVAPHCPTMTTFFLSAAIIGLSCGCYDTAQIVWMMEMMQKACPPYVLLVLHQIRHTYKSVTYVQCQHFCYALGAALASLIMGPFLNKESEDTITAVSSQEVSSFAKTTSIPAEEPSPTSQAGVSKLFIPYTILGTLTAVGAVMQFLLYVFMRYYPPPPENMEAAEHLEVETKTDTKLESRFKIGDWSLPKLRLVILSAAVCGAYQGMEMCTFQFFPKFGQNSKLALSESESTFVLSGMTAAFAIGRGIGIIIVFKLSAQLILCGNIILLFIANVLLFGWANSSLLMLWACSVIYGFGFSSVYASFTAYIERYLIFTNFIGSTMLVCGSSIAAIYPLIVGNSIEENPIVLSFTGFFSIIIIILSFGTLSFLTHNDKKRY